MWKKNSSIMKSNEWIKWNETLDLNIQTNIYQIGYNNESKFRRERLGTNGSI